MTPGLVDSHTHLIYAGDRGDEVAARSRGQRYDGGGILRTVLNLTRGMVTHLVVDSRTAGDLVKEENLIERDL